MVKNSVMYGRIRYIDVKLYFIRKVIEDGEVSIEYILTVENRADVFTKGFFRVKYEEYITAFGIV